MERLLLLLTLFMSPSMLKIASADDDNYGLNVKLNVDPTEYFSSKVTVPGPSFMLLPKSTIGPVKPDFVDCQTNQGEENFGTTLKNFSISLEDIGSASACLNVKDGINERFSTNNCKLLTQCAASKMNKDKGSIAGFFGIPKMMAEDYVNLQLQQNLKDMEKIEALRKFAEKKYGKDFASKCNSVFNYDAANNDKDICDKSVMDGGFARSQKKCNVVKVSCYNSGFDSTKDYSGFLSTYKPASEDESSLQNFFASKTDNQVNDSLASDNEVLEALASIISGKEKTNDKVHDVFAKLNEFKKQGKIDPIFNFGTDYISDVASLYKKSTHYQFLAKALAKPMDMAQARSLIEKYRRDFAKENLNRLCPSIPKYSEICSVATEVLKSKRTHVIDRRTSAMIFNNDSDDERYFTIKSIFPIGVRSKSDYSVVMDANRCKAFDYIDIAEDAAARIQNTFNTYDISNPSYSPTLMGTGFGTTSFYDNPYSQYAKITSPKDELIIKSNNKPLFTMPESAISGSKQFVGPSVPGSGVEKSDKIITAGADDLTSSLGAGMKETAAIMAAPSTNNQAIVNSSYVSPNSFSNYAANTGDVKTGGADSSKNTVSSTASANNLLNARINELTKKLTNSEDNLARLQEAKVEAQAEKEHQRKVDDENRSIADLKEQLNDLKTQTASKSNDDDTGTTNKLAANTKDGSSRTLTRGPASESSKEEETHATAAVAAKPNQDNGAQTSAHAGGNYSSGGNEGGPVSGTRSASGGSSSTGSLTTTGSSGGSGIVLTKTDSVSDDAIQEKILEFNNGQHFFIQEGDMVQEIVPVVKDGKILLNDDGKPQFTRGKATKKEKKSARAVAEEKNTATNDSADLKRQEEERVSRERAEYLKLKKLTNDIIEKQ